MARATRLVGIAMLLGALACAKRPAAGGPAGTAASASSATPVASAPPEPTSPSNAALRFEIVENMEMVQYCLRYPASLMKEDVEQRYERGRRVFIARSTPKGATPSRIDFSATCGPRSLEELFEDDRRNVRGVTKAMLDDGVYVLQWRTGTRLHYGKVWSAKDDPGCFVKALIEYDQRDEDTFDSVIALVAWASPACPGTPVP